jgi:hypothetical protein
VRFLALGVVAAIIALSSLTSTLDGDVTPIVFSGQPAPGTANGRFDNIGGASVNVSGDMVFTASLDVGGIPGAGVFKIVGGRISPVVLEGQPLPDNSGRYFGGGLGSSQINSNGDVVFTSNFDSDGTGTNFGWGLFLYAGGVLRKIFDSGTPVPGMSGQTFTSFGGAQINDVGDIAFVGGVDASPAGLKGVYLLSNGNLTPVTVQSNFSSNDFSLNNRRDIVFVSDSGISQFSGGSIRSIVTLGQAVPNTSLTVLASQPWINDDGDVAFRNFEVRPSGRGNVPTPFPNAILRWRQGVLDKIAAAGDSVPGIPGATFRFSSFGAPRINESAIVFDADTEPSPGRPLTSLICRFENGQLSVIARGDQFVPGFGIPSGISGPNFDNRQGPLVTFVANSGALVTPPSPEGIYSIQAGPYSLLFPHLADGMGAGGGWRTTFILANRSAMPASATVSFFDDNGAPMNVFVAGQPQNQVNINVPALGIAQFQTDGSGSLKTGWAKVQSDQSLSGIDLFTFYDGIGTFVGEVGVQPSVPLRSMSMIVDAGTTAATGIALANPNTAAAAVTLMLKDSNATEIARSTITVPAMGHLAKYSGEIFSGMLSINPQGKIEVVSDLPIVAISLRQRGTVFNSLPIIP